MRAAVVLLACAVAVASATPPATDYAAKLRSLGYRASEIAEIRPSVARVVAHRGLPRPRAGMPESWREVDQSAPKPNPFAGLVARAKALGAAAASLFRKAAVPVAVVVAGAKLSDAVEAAKLAAPARAPRPAPVRAPRPPPAKRPRPAKGDDCGYLFDGPNERFPRFA